MRCNREPQQGGLPYETSRAGELGQTWLKGISGERAKMLLRQQQPT